VSWRAMQCLTLEARLVAAGELSSPKAMANTGTHGLAHGLARKACMIKLKST
jgi:hypothetical protein